MNGLLSPARFSDMNIMEKLLNQIWFELDTQAKLEEKLMKHWMNSKKESKHTWLL